MASTCDEINAIERAKVRVIVSVGSRVMVGQGLFLNHSHLLKKSDHVPCFNRNTKSIIVWNGRELQW